MLAPYIANAASSSKYLSVNDNMLGKAFRIDVPKSISLGQVAVKDTIDLPDRILDWLPLSESSSVSLVLEGEESIFRYSDKNVTDDYKDFHFYKSFIGEQYVTHLSGFILGNGDSSTVAVALCFFPQVLYFDVQNGTSSSVAFNKDYQKWKDVSRRQLNMDSVEYFTGAISSRDYIFMLYEGKTLAQMAEAPQSTVIQVLDWKGNYLYEINVEEDLSNIAVDERHGYLYCIEKRTSSIVRYDLSTLKL